jgi:hypothetical protein
MNYLLNYKVKKYSTHQTEASNFSWPSRIIVALTLIDSAQIALVGTVRSAKVTCGLISKIGNEDDACVEAHLIDRTLEGLVGLR